MTQDEMMEEQNRLGRQAQLNGEKFLADWHALLLEVKNPTKNATNPFLKNRYADLGSVIEATRDLLAKHGFTLSQSLHWDGVANIPVVRVESQFSHHTGNVKSFTTAVALKEVSPQGTMGAFTYGRRYAIMAALNIAAEDDDDDGNAASGFTAKHEPSVSGIKSIIQGGKK